MDSYIDYTTRDSSQNETFDAIYAQLAQTYLPLVNNCKPEDALLSSTRLGELLSRIALHHVNASDVIKLTRALNVEQLIPLDSGLARDYRGLAELMGFDMIDLETRFKRSHNPAHSLVEAYVHKTSRGATLNDLLKLIERLQRFDVIDDSIDDLVRMGARAALVQQHTSTPRIELTTSSSSSSSFSNSQLQQSQHRLALTSNNANSHVNERFDKLTIDDTARVDVIKYDAFVCYAPEDAQHAHALIGLLNGQFGKQLVTADDLLPGHFEHDALMQLIDTRCRKVIIVLTPNFSQSKECEFQTKYASEIGFKDQRPNIIPVLCEPCDFSTLPRMIQVMSKIDLTGDNTRHQWQLNKLLYALAPDGLARSHSPNAQEPAQSVQLQQNHHLVYNALQSDLHRNLAHDNAFAHADSVHAAPIVSQPLSVNASDSAIECVVAQTHSQSIDTSQAAHATHDTNHAHNNSSTLRWLQSVRRKMLGHKNTASDNSGGGGGSANNSSGMISPSTSSQAPLLGAADMQCAGDSR